MDPKHKAEAYPYSTSLNAIHFRLTRFVPEGEIDYSSKTRTKKYKIDLEACGDEVKHFYEEVTKGQEDKPKTSAARDAGSNVDNRRKTVKPKEPFDQHKYFLYALNNEAEKLENMDINLSNVNTRDAYHWTALMVAACEGAKDAVKILLRLGIDKEAKEKSGKTAEQLALKKGFHDVVQLLNTVVSTPEQNDQLPVQHTSSQRVLRPFFCCLCQKEFAEVSRREHEASTVHQFNSKSDLPANPLIKFNIPQKNRGLQLMVKQGWDRESGLGPSHSGRLYPVKTVIRRFRTGLGIDQMPARVTHFNANDRRGAQPNAAHAMHKPRTRQQVKRERLREAKRQRRLRNELS